MGTFYVSKAGSNPGTENDPTDPYLTIAAAIAAASASDIVEIIDEGTYAEDDTWFNVNNLTIRHTASWLGRPKITGGGTQTRAFYPGSGATDTTYIGLEISDYTGYIFNDGGAGYDRFHMSGCFIHDVPILGINSFSAPAGNPATIKQCIMFFEPSGLTAIHVAGGMEIYNCLITGSNGDNDNSLLYDAGVNATASFCTIINRTDDRSGTPAPIIRFSQVGDCMVSASSALVSGIASNNRGYNAVAVDYSVGDPATETTAFRTFADVSASAGTGEIVVTKTEIGFVRPEEIGNTSAIAEAYKLTEDSSLIGAGLATNDIYVDLIDTVRPQDSTYDIGAYEYISSDPVWTEYSSQPDSNFKDGFIIQTYNNLPSNYKFRYTDDPGQAPFSLGTKGPSTLRSRSKPYKTTK